MVSVDSESRAALEMSVLQTEFFGKIAVNGITGSVGDGVVGVEVASFEALVVVVCALGVQADSASINNSM